MQENERPVTTSIQYPETKLRKLSMRALELGYRSRNELISKILDDWFAKNDKKKRA